MKKILPLALALFIGLNGLMAQEKRKSPLEKIDTEVGKAKVHIEYGSPSKKDRVIFGELVPYGKVWRTGANEATVIETDKDLTIGGKKLPAGKYSVFTIPQKGQWTVIFNSVWEQWGAYKYDESKDVIRVVANASEGDKTEEMFTIGISGGELWFMWDKTRAAVSIK